MHEHRAWPCQQSCPLQYCNSFPVCNSPPSLLFSLSDSLSRSLPLSRSHLLTHSLTHSLSLSLAHTSSPAPSSTATLSRYPPFLFSFLMCTRNPACQLNCPRANPTSAQPGVTSFAFAKQDLEKAFCGGAPCTTDAQKRQCATHFLDHGMGEGRAWPCAKVPPSPALFITDILLGV